MGTSHSFGPSGSREGSPRLRGDDDRGGSRGRNRAGAREVDRRLPLAPEGVLFDTVQMVLTMFATTAERIRLRREIAQCQIGEM